MTAYLVVYGTLQSPYPTLDRLGLSAAVRVVGPSRLGGPSLVSGSGADSAPTGATGEKRVR